MDRREFIKQMGQFGMAGIALSLFPWMESCSDQAKKQVSGETARIGVIGTGSRGQYHIANLLKIPAARITALCDNYEPFLDQASAMCPDAKRYGDYRALLEDPNVDAVVIVTPSTSISQWRWML